MTVSDAEIARLRAEIERLRAAVEWQPIETAETDPRVLAEELVLVKCGVAEEPFIAQRSPQTRHWFDDIGILVTPTHWRHIDPPGDG